MRPRPSTEVAKRIRNIMNQKNMRSKDISEILGVNEMTVSQNINGNPTIKTLSKIARALKVPLWQFFISPDELGEALKDKEFAHALGLQTFDTLNRVTICPSCGMPVNLKGIDLKKD